MPLLSEANRRKRNLLIIAGFLFLVGAANLVDTGVYAPDLPLASNITVFALLNLNLIVLLLLVVLLCRNLIKLWFERRQNVIGAKFKTKLVLAFLSLSLAPAILIFLIASNFINKSIEGWFKPQVERPLDQALAVAQTYYNNLERTALRHAQHIGRVVDRDGLLGGARRAALATYLVDAQEQLGISAITVFNAQGQEFVYHTIKLTNATVSELRAYLDLTDTTGDPYDAHELEDVSFAFQKIEIENKEAKTAAADDWNV